MMVIILVIWGLAIAQEVPNDKADIGAVTAVPDTVWAAHQASLSEPIGLRMKSVTTPLLGLPYILDGIGELQAPDTDPFVRYDGFDCLTFVEEAIALALAYDQAQLADIRLHLRYHSDEYTYETRNHFMISQWIPNAIAKGYLRDITHTLGETHVVSKEITRQNWERWRGRHGFEIDPSEFPVGKYRLGLLSLDAALQAIPNLPEGALILVVRQNNPHNPVWISHLGFVVRHSDTDIRIRHATKLAGGVVKEHYLKWYFEHLRQYRRPIEGILVLMPQDNRPQDN